MKFYQLNVDFLINTNDLIECVQYQIPSDFHDAAYKAILYFDNLLKERLPLIIEKRAKPEFLFECNPELYLYFSNKFDESESTIRKLMDYFRLINLFSIVEKDIKEEIAKDNIDVYDINGNHIVDNIREKLNKEKYSKKYIVNAKAMHDSSILCTFVDIVKSFSVKEDISFAIHVCEEIIDVYSKYKKEKEDDPFLNEENTKLCIEYISNSLDIFTKSVSIINIFLDKNILFECDDNFNKIPKNGCHSFKTILKL